MDEFLSNFLIIEFCKFFALYGCGYLLGLWVMKKNVKVNYTRKILHFIIFFLPIFMTTQLTFQHNMATLLISGFIFVGTVLLMDREGVLSEVDLCRPVPEQERADDAAGVRRSHDGPDHCADGV